MPSSRDRYGVGSKPASRAGATPRSRPVLYPALGVISTARHAWAVPTPLRRSRRYSPPSPSCVLRPRRPIWTPVSDRGVPGVSVAAVSHTPRHHAQVRRPGSATGTSETSKRPD
jgi:hypothetical protein